MNRRDFIKTVGISAAAVALPSFLLPKERLVDHAYIVDGVFQKTVKRKPNTFEDYTYYGTGICGGDLDITGLKLGIHTYQVRPLSEYGKQSTIIIESSMFASGDQIIVGDENYTITRVEKGVYDIVRRV